MRFTETLYRNARRFYTELDFARHMPKEYVEKVKRTVPKKIYDNRYGAPPIVRWALHPDDYVPSDKRPWELSEYDAASVRARKYHNAKLGSKYFDIRRKESVAIPKEEWTIFPGDVVQVMVGKDKGKTGTVSHVIRETNAVFVMGRHTKFVNEYEGAERIGVKPMYRHKEQPLYIHKKQVMLVDPSDNEPCEAEWKVDEDNFYVRYSKRSGFVIPIPELAYTTSEYITPDKYVDAPEKDTPPEAALERTYRPVLKSFEEEICEEFGIKENRELQPSYWY